MTYSPLRYPGGKSKLTPFLERLIAMNGISHFTYMEPYAGGSGVGLNLLYSGKASRIVINDVDRSIYSFWQSVVSANDKFCDAVENAPLIVDFWKEQKEVQRRKKHANLFELGFSTFYLNRTNRSGIIKAGVIGGIKQESEWKMDARFNKKDLLIRLQKINEFKDNIQVSNVDAVQLLKNMSHTSADSFIYLDPPYYRKGKDLYYNYYAESDHQLLRDQLKKMKSSYWIVSYDNVHKISKLYEDYRKKIYSLMYSVYNHSKGREILVFSPQFRKLPKTVNNS